MIVFLLLMCLLISLKEESHMLRIVKTENGLVRGFPGNNTRISVFKGIPFAEPPVGENRWKAPMPCKDWEGIKDC